MGESSVPDWLELRTINMQIKVIECVEIRKQEENYL